MEKVVQMEVRIKEKLFYCYTGTMQVVVPERFITEKHEFIIKAEQGFQITVQPSKVAGGSGIPVLNIGLSVMKNLIMNCSLICDLSEEDPLYKGVIDQMAQMKL